MSLWWMRDARSVGWWPRRPARGSIGNMDLVQGNSRGRSPHEVLLASSGTSGGGIGHYFSNDAVGSTNLDGAGRGSSHLSVLVWNAGDLDRRVTSCSEVL